MSSSSFSFLFLFIYSSVCLSVALGVFCNDLGTTAQSSRVKNRRANRESRFRKQADDQPVRQGGTLTGRNQARKPPPKPSLAPRFERIAETAGRSRVHWLLPSKRRTRQSRPEDDDGGPRVLKPRRETTTEEIERRRYHLLIWPFNDVHFDAFFFLFLLLLFEATARPIPAFQRNFGGW